MVWKLLRKNISVGQIFGYSIASLIGLSIVISAVKIYDDVRSIFEDEDSFISKDYIVISKQVSTAGTLGLGGSGTTFSEEELEDLRQQPWVREVGEFQAADFNVLAALDFGGRGMSTQLFFEAIPNEFFDIESDKWTFSPPASSSDATQQDINLIEIPVVISRDYLTLYNFGYATGRGLPQINESLVSKVPLTFYLSGNGHREVYKGRIVGFSSRLNTIAVPENFMEWANERYSSEGKTSPSRLIIEANTPGDPRIQQYMTDHSYEVAGDKADNGRANYFLTVATTIVIAVGIVITVLSFFILMLSIYLLLQKNRQKLHDLMLLGYSPTQVSRPYYMLVGIINLSVLILAILVMLCASRYWVSQFSAIGIKSASPATAVIVGFCISVCVTILNCAAIRSIIRKNFFQS